MSLRHQDPWDQLARANRNRTDARLALLRLVLVVMFVGLIFGVLAAGFAH